ncbi:MAG: sensor domain-containing diguanylate cyclase [Dehalococcoidia bacterium]
MLEKLAQLSNLCTAQDPRDSDVVRACRVVRDGLGAEEAYVVRSGDPHFERLGDSDDPSTYEIKQKGFWLVWERLARNPDIPAGSFEVAERLVLGGGILAPGQPCTHVACILPGEESNSELLVVRGPWPEGLTPEDVEFVVAARPMLAYLVQGVVDGERQVRQREQLAALADVSRAFSEAQANEEVLSSVATALAKASGFDFVLVLLFDEQLEHVIEGAINRARHSETETATMARDGRLWENVGRPDPSTIEAWRQGRPMLIPDVFAPDLEERPDLQGMRDSLPGLRAYYQRAHVLSTATFPILFQGRLLGTATFTSSTHRRLDPPEVGFLSALVSQAATTIKGLRLYRDLEASREELRKYAEQLEESGRIEHLLARTDALTGLPNRRYIEETMATETARAGRYGEAVSVAMADLDRFKEINDGYGHQTGDDALRFVASVARQACRQADLVGRWGGDEFLFILPFTAVTEATHFAERFREGLAERTFTHAKLAQPVRITASLGVAQANEATFSNAALLLERADRAMYDAKEAGRNRTVVAGADARAA